MSYLVKHNLLLSVKNLLPECAHNSIKKLYMATSLSHNLAVLMAAKKFNTVSLSKKSGVNQPYISDLRAGRKTNPTLDVLIKLARALGVTVEQLSGLAELRNIDTAEPVSPEILRKAEFIASLPPDHWARRAIETILADAEKERGK